MALARYNGLEIPTISGTSVQLDKAAEILGCSRRTIYNLIREGRLVTFRTKHGQRSQRVEVESVRQEYVRRVELAKHFGTTQSAQRNRRLREKRKRLKLEAPAPQATVSSQPEGNPS